MKLCLCQKKSEKKSENPRGAMTHFLSRTYFFYFSTWPKMCTVFLALDFVKSVHIVICKSVTLSLSVLDFTQERVSHDISEVLHCCNCVTLTFTTDKRINVELLACDQYTNKCSESNLLLCYQLTRV